MEHIDLTFHGIVLGQVQHIKRMPLLQVNTHLSHFAIYIICLLVSWASFFVQSGATDFSLSSSSIMNSYSMLQAFQEWKSERRAELTQFQKQVEEQYMSNVERQLERMQNARNARRGNGPSNMQEMDKELDTHRAEHGPKTRRVLEGGNDDEDDMDDMAVEDELMDEVLGINEPISDEQTKPSEEAADGVPVSEEVQ